MFDFFDGCDEVVVFWGLFVYFMYELIFLIVDENKFIDDEGYIIGVEIIFVGLGKIFWNLCCFVDDVDSYVNLGLLLEVVFVLLLFDGFE